MWISLLRVIILVSLVLRLIHELTLELSSHLVHHWVLSLGHLRVHHDRLLLARCHHHNGLSVTTLSHGWHHHAGLCWWRHHGLRPDAKERAAVLRLIQVVKHRVHVELAETLVFNEVLDGKHVHSHLLSLLKEPLFRLGEVAGNLTWLQGSAHAHLVRELLSLHLGAGQGLNAALSHVTDKLSGQLGQRFPGQKRRVVLELIEGDELYDVGRSVLAERLGVESFVITVKHVHGGEVRIADANDNDRQWVVAASDNLVDRLLNVVDDTVGDDQQHLELLVAIAAWVGLSHAVHCVEDAAEVRGPVQIHDVHAVLVVVHDSLEPIDLRVEDVAIHRETVVRALVVWGHAGTETEKIDLFIGVIVLQDTADLVNHLQILVAGRVKVVERLRGAGVPITQREVDRDGQVNIAAAKNVLEERVFLLEFAVVYAE